MRTLQLTNAPTLCTKSILNMSVTFCDVAVSVSRLVKINAAIPI